MQNFEQPVLEHNFLVHLEPVSINYFGNWHTCRVLKESYQKLTCYWEWKWRMLALSRAGVSGSIQEWFYQGLNWTSEICFQKQTLSG